MLTQDPSRAARDATRPSGSRAASPPTRSSTTTTLNQYGFGALRCAVDNLNGDNVEWIAYPSGAAHVFCYAYYVKPPPTAGAIIVRKEVDAPAGTAAQDFRFAGNLSYNEDKKFTPAAHAPGSAGLGDVLPGGRRNVDDRRGGPARLGARQPQLHLALRRERDHDQPLRSRRSRWRRATR